MNAIAEFTKHVSLLVALHMVLIYCSFAYVERASGSSTVANFMICRSCHVLIQHKISVRYVKEDSKGHVVDNQHALVSKGFLPSVGNSFAMILVTELGDKTFFVAAILG
jgi:hypothetical protein